jgi:glutamate synthase domain-containing protein 2
MCSGEGSHQCPVGLATQDEKRRKPNKWETREDETTTWFFGESSNLNSGLLPFGWVIIEVVSR